MVEFSVPFRGGDVIAQNRLDQTERTHVAQSSEATASSTLRGRFWIACTLVVPANLVWCVWIFSVNPGGPWFDECPLLANVVFVLFAFAGLNALFRRYQPRWTFSQTELLLLYTVLAISTAVGGSCYGQCLPIVMAYPLWAGQLSVDGVTNPAAVHDWSSFLSYLPSWAVIADYQALRGFWMGNSILYNWAILRAWTVPVLAWSGFVTVLFLLTMCLNVLLRRTWVHAERLTFPIVWLPLEMTRPSGELFRSRLLWVGFAPAFAITFFNGLHLFFPTLPVIQISHRSIQGYFPDPPFNAMANLTVCLHPLMIGLGYLLPQELLFSSWFFHLYWQGLRVLTSVAGFTPAEQQVSFPYVSEQAFGGFLVLGVLAVWGARRALRIAWKRAISTPSSSGKQSSGEALSDRAAFVGFILSFVAVAAFFVVLGMSLVTALLVLSLLVVMFTAITRIRAETGGPLLDMYPYLSPSLSLTKLAGTSAFSPRELTALSLNQWHVVYGFNQPMPYGMEALKMAGEKRRSQRRFFIAALAAATIGIIGTVFVELNYAYSLGEAQFNKTGWAQLEIWPRLNNWLTAPAKANFGVVFGTMLGAGATLLIAIMRLRYIGWCLHPVPFVVTAGAGTFVGFFWMPFLIAWILKLVIVRYWGRKGFCTALPFFLGLILGEMIGGMVWPLYGVITQSRCYSFFGA